MKYIWIVLFIKLTIISCIYKKHEVVIPKIIIPKLEISGYPDTVVFSPNSMYQFITNTPANWLIENIDGGQIDSLGKLVTGNSEGLFSITITNKLDQNDKIIRKFITLKQASFFNEIKKGGFILSFRHANASTGSDNLNSASPQWWKSCDSKLARQITDPIGYKQSDSTGKVMKLLKIPFDTTFTSEFCRCKQTIETFKLDRPIKELKDLTFSVYDETNRYANTMKLFSGFQVNNKCYLVVGHAGFGKTPTPAPLATLEWGDCAVFKQTIQGYEPGFVGNITLKEWLRLARVLKI